MGVGINQMCFANTERYVIRNDLQMKYYMLHNYLRLIQTYIIIEYHDNYFICVVEIPYVSTVIT